MNEYAKVVIPHKNEALIPGVLCTYGVFMPSGESLPNVTGITIKPEIDGLTEVTITMLAEIETSE